MNANGETAVLTFRCQTCGEDIYAPDYGGDLDQYHVSDNTLSWPDCKRPVTLRKRHHPDGFVLWDVLIGERFVGTARQQPVAAPSWFAYNLRGDELGRYPFRRDAVAALVSEATNG